jgi:3-methyl-2-oxobutanoate hydroxymethyltransferase
MIPRTNRGDMPMSRWTAAAIRQTKGEHKLACLTAYDYALARIVDEAGIHVVLVGDSLAMTMLGYATTLPVTVDEMLHHTAAVARGVEDALVVADMPFMSYQVSLEQALGNAGRFIKEAGAGAVKIEGGSMRVPTVRALVENGIPVLGHIGLTPQSIRETGGYKIQGRRPQEAAQLVQDAQDLARAGVFAIVLECMPAELAAEITGGLEVPTIGIGAGPHCDGQILVIHDVLGLYSGVSPKFVKRYADLGSEIRNHLVSYREDVEQGRFPAEEHCY